MKVFCLKIGFLVVGLPWFFLGCTKSPRRADSPSAAVQASAEPHIASLALSEIKGGYPVEVAPEGRLNWVKDTITYEYAVPEKSDLTAFVLEAEIISIVPNLTFTIVDRQGAASGQRIIELPESYQAWSQAAKLKVAVPRGPQSNKLALEFITANKPTIISANDKREATFLIRNLRVNLR